MMNFAKKSMLGLCTLFGFFFCSRLAGSAFMLLLYVALGAALAVVFIFLCRSGRQFYTDHGPVAAVFMSGVVVRAKRYISVRKPEDLTMFEAPRQFVWVDKLIDGHQNDPQADIIIEDLTGDLFRAWYVSYDLRFGRGGDARWWFADDTMRMIILRAYAAYDAKRFYFVSAFQEVVDKMQTSYEKGFYFDSAHFDAGLSWAWYNFSNVYLLGDWCLLFGIAIGLGFIFLVKKSVHGYVPRVHRCVVSVLLIILSYCI
jgi:hypothetical protein